MQKKVRLLIQFFLYKLLAREQGAWKSSIKFKATVLRCYVIKEYSNLIGSSAVDQIIRHTENAWGWKI